MQKITWILKNELLSGLLSLYFPLWTSSLSRSHFPLILNCVSCYWFSSDFSRWFYNAFDVDIFPIRIGKLLPFFFFFQSFYYLLYETRVPLFSSWEIPFPHLFMFAFFIFLSKWRYECETCVAGAKKYNNTFNFEANKWHAFTISIARHLWYWFLWIETTLRPFSPYFIPFSIEYNLNLQTLLFVSEHKLENGYGVYAILFLSLSVNLHHFFSLSQVFNLATVDCITKQNRFGKWEQFSWWDSSSFAITITTFRGLKNARKFPLSGRWFQFQIAG